MFVSVGWFSACFDKGIASIAQLYLHWSYVLQNWPMLHRGCASGNLESIKSRINTYFGWIWLQAASSGSKRSVCRLQAATPTAVQNGGEGQVFLIFLGHYCCCWWRRTAKNRPSLLLLLLLLLLTVELLILFLGGYVHRFKPQVSPHQCRHTIWPSPIWPRSLTTWRWHLRFAH